MTVPVLWDQPETAADRVDVIARIKAVTDLLDQFETDVRDRLEQDVRAAQETVGGQFTLRADAGTAYVAGGNPKVRVVDEDAFGAWCEAVDASLVERTVRVEVTDHQLAAEVLQGIPAVSPLDVVNRLVNCLTVEDVWVIAGDAVDRLTEAGHVKVSGQTLFDLSSGEPVPGTQVTFSRETLTVKPKAEVRAGYRRELQGLLGLPEGGDSDD